MSSYKSIYNCRNCRARGVWPGGPARPCPRALFNITETSIHPHGGHGCSVPRAHPGGVRRRQTVGVHEVVGAAVLEAEPVVQELRIVLKPGIERPCPELEGICLCAWLFLWK